MKLKRQYVSPNFMSKKRKILIVEDEASLSHILDSKLTAFGYEVEIADDGEVAVKKILGSSYDLILLDLIMPKLDGFGVLDSLQKNNIKVPVIVLSNLGQDEDIKKAMRFGARAYFVKSNILVGDVVSEVNKILDKS